MGDDESVHDGTPYGANQPAEPLQLEWAGRRTVWPAIEKQPYLWLPARVIQELKKKVIFPSANDYLNDTKKRSKNKNQK